MWKTSLLAASAMIASSIAFAGSGMDSAKDHKVMTSATGQAEDMSRPMALSGASSGSTESEITTALQNLGYTDVSQAEMRGDIYTADAKWQGEPVKIRVDRADGRINDLSSSEAEYINASSGMTNDRLTSELNDLGYTNVREIEKVGGVYLAKADMDGKTQNLRVDTATGQVITGELSGPGVVRGIDDASNEEVINKVMMLGYEDPHSINREGDVISVKATKNGEPVDLNIDADSGIVTRVN
jgi:hypothetical protein